jgi:hypothetical protein
MFSIISNFSLKNFYKKNKVINIAAENSSFILWGDEIFGRHTLSSRGWGLQDKQNVEPTLLLVRPTRVDH